ncbi:LOW QUALITY PROTEIN: olfactory receptor 4S1-like [Rhynchonycteris naso]
MVPEHGKLLPLCGPRVLDHYFCDVYPVLQLAYVDTFLVGMLIIASGSSISVISFTALLASYVVILHSLRGQALVCKDQAEESPSGAVWTLPRRPAAPLWLLRWTRRVAVVLISPTVTAELCIDFFKPEKEKTLDEKMILCVHLSELCPRHFDGSFQTSVNPSPGSSFWQRESPQLIKMLRMEEDPLSPTAINKSQSFENPRNFLIRDDKELTTWSENSVTEFVLLGLFQSRELHVCFVAFSLFHMLTVLGNLLVITTITASKALHAPVYFFLSHLSFADMCYPSGTTPKMITDTFMEHKTISFNGCMTQLFSSHFFGDTEIFLLTAVAYDRYVTICRHLHYATIMDRKCGLLVGASWVAGSLHSILQTPLMVQPPFCGPSEIDSFFCNVNPLLKLACADTVVGLTVVANSGMVSVVSFIILPMSYVVTLLNPRSRSSEGRHKALSTCVSHIVTVLLALVPLVFMYIPPSITLAADKPVILFNIVMPPLLNSLIDSLRNNEVKNATRKVSEVRSLGEK